MRWLLSFIYHYPLFMAFVWMLGSLIYVLRRRNKISTRLPVLVSTPSVSILIPCHNEEKHIRETIEQMSKLNYPDYEIIAINDGSTDNTQKILEECTAIYPKLRIVTLKKNQGKATALKFGLLAAKSEFLVCIDADAFLDRDALYYLMWHFINFPRVGAVTGNPRIRNRTTLLGKIQVGEYSTIIGMIKRTQRIIGKIFTVSGVAAAFRKSALFDVGLWDDDMVTEDIDISWKLQTNFWDVRFEERALCWILTPETLKGLWKQRLRWAQGGAEVILKYGRALFDFRQRRIWPVYLEYGVSVFWSYALYFSVIIALINSMGIIGLLPPLPDPWSFAVFIPPEWAGTMLATVCMLQAMVALAFESKFEKGIFRYIFWFIWYPIIYWLLSATATVAGLPLAIFKRKGTKAIWESPDRGLHTL